MSYIMLRIQSSKFIMSKEELLLTYWRELPPETQGQVLEAFRSLQPDQENPNELAPEHLNELILEGINSGEPIAITDEWWEIKRRTLLERVGK